jgi:hypothetical protein
MWPNKQNMFVRISKKRIIKAEKHPVAQCYSFCSGCTKCIRLIKWWILGGQMGGHLLIRYLLCVINFSHTFWLTFSKPCTVVMDTLKRCVWLLEVYGYFSKNLHVVELSLFSSMLAGGRVSSPRCVGYHSGRESIGQWSTIQNFKILNHGGMITPPPTLFLQRYIWYYMYVIIGLAPTPLFW